MSRRSRRYSAALVVLTLVAAACSSGDGGSAGDDVSAGAATPNGSVFGPVDEYDARTVVQPDGPRPGVPDTLPPMSEFEAFPLSSFTTPLPSEPAISANSESYVALLAKVVADDGAALALRTFTNPVYLADDTTPRRDVALSADWAPARVLFDVPIPDGALADPEDDGNIIIIDQARRCEWDMWQVHRVGDQWQASWANAVDLDGNGVFPTGLSSRGSGFALSQGMIWPEELRRGRIEHALIFSYPFTSSAGSVGESTESDGWSDRSDALPEGARLRLDPTFDIGSLGLLGWQATLARAMQEYGLVLVDDGGGVQLYGIHSWSAVQDPWLGIIDGRAEYVSLDAIPFDRLEVLDFGTPVEREVVFNPGRCARFDVAGE